MKGDDAMGNRLKGIINTILDLTYTMSANIAGGALLAKTVQSIIPATSVVSTRQMMYNQLISR